jgi:transposase
MAGLELASRLSAEELGERYRAARDRVERGHPQVIWLLAQGRGAAEVARVMGLSERWGVEIVRRSNEDGPEGLGDRRRSDAGARPLLDEAQRQALVRALRGPAPDGGSWSGPKVAAWIAEATGRTTRPRRGWDYLKRLGFSLKRPRPRHAKADAAAQAAFKKGLAGAAG